MYLPMGQLDLNFFQPCDSVNFISVHPEIVLLVDNKDTMLEIKDLEESLST